MRHVLFSLIFISLAVQPILADTVVQQGSAQDNVSVSTNVQGSVHTHIESTVNGKTKVLDSNKPGTYTLHNSSDSTSSSSSSQTTVIQQSTNVTPIQKPSIPSPTSIYKNRILDPMKNLQIYFHQIIQKLLSLFHM